VAIDGKWLCGAHERGEEPVKLLAAFSTELHGVVASVKVPKGGSEIGTVCELLRRFPLEGATITGDAAFTRASVARQIVEGGGDYFLTVKDNHRHLRRDLAAQLRPGGDSRARRLNGRTAATGDMAAKKSATSRPCPCRSVICTGLARPRLAGLHACGGRPKGTASRPSMR
jgi:DDE family transposase